MCSGGSLTWKLSIGLFMRRRRDCATVADGCHPVTPSAPPVTDYSMPLLAHPSIVISMAEPDDAVVTPPVRHWLYWAEKRGGMWTDGKLNVFAVSSGSTEDQQQGKVLTATRNQVLWVGLCGRDHPRHQDSVVLLFDRQPTLGREAHWWADDEDLTYFSAEQTAYTPLWLVRPGRWMEGSEMDRATRKKRRLADSVSS